LGKVKIHELAKEIDLTSKEVIAKAQEMNIEVKSHLSTLTDQEVKLLKKELAKNNNVKEKSKTKKSKDEKNIKEVKETKNKKEKPETPVIIRREVIISEEEIERKEEEEKKKKQTERKENIGFMERNSNKEYNIVYRNKPSKPLTVEELFGLGKKKEEPKVEEIKEEKVVEKEKKEEETVVNNDLNEKTEKSPKQQNNYENRNNNYVNNRNNNSNNYNNNRNNNNYSNTRNNNFGNNNNNNYNNNRNSNYNNNRNNNFGNNGNNNYNNNRNNNFGNNNNNNYNNNRSNNFGNNNNYRNNNQGNFANKRHLDEKGIEKNIKNILASETIEKEPVREYNRSIDKQKNNRYDDNKAKKSQRSKKSEDYNINQGKLKSLKQESSLSNMFSDSDGGMLDYYDLTTIRGRRNRRRTPKQPGEKSKQKIFKLTEIIIPETILVKDLAAELKKTSSDVIKKLLNYGIMATINNSIDYDTAFLIAEEFGVKAIKKEIVTEEDVLFDDSEDKENDLKQRPPVVVVMGHVDHGKTSLLDAVRSTNIIDGEAGGITQHIGAYQVNVKDRDITFLDTPGHEAFTNMRARGAQITDIAILVVAADDGVMPQTIEAINHSKSAGIPIIVAVNKIDLPGANPDKIKEELMKYELVPEEWGGDTIFVNISAKKRENIDQLLEMVLLVADMQELKTNPNKQAKGVVIEARLDKTKGPIATILVQRGALDLGDTIVVGSSIGRIRAMKDDKSKNVKKAGASTPVEIMGLTEVPSAGDVFYEVKNEKMAKSLIERRKRQEREKIMSLNSKVTLDDLFSQIEKGNLKQLNLIVKADVQGTVEAVKQSLEKLSNDEVKVKVIHSNAGAVTESDVTLAKVSKAIIIAFNVRPMANAKDMADKDEVEIKQYSIIYKAIEDVEAAMKGLLDPEFEEKIIGTAEVRQTFKVSNVGTISGAYVLTGKLERNAGVRVIREDVVIHEGKLSSLKRFKDDVKEVAKGYECGLQLEGYNDVKELDIIEAFIMEEIKR